MNINATDRSRIEDDLLESQRELALLADVSRAFAEVGHDLEVVLSTITATIATRIGDCCAIRLLSADGAYLEARALHHRDPALMTLLRTVFGGRDSSNAGLSAEAIRSGRAIKVDALPLETLLTAFPDQAEHALIRSTPVRAVMVAPLIARGVVLGTVALARTHDERPYTDRERQLLEDIAGRAALAIMTARHHDALETARGRLSLLASASERLATSLDYQTTLDNVIAVMVPALGDFACFDVFEPDRTRRLVHAPGDPARHGLLEAPGRSAEQLAALPELGAVSMISVPLIVRGRMLGALAVFRRAGARPHGHDDHALAAELARRAASAVENARLFREARNAVGARDEFLALAGHELRTPLTALQLQVFSVVKLLGEGAALELISDRAEKASRNVLRLGLLVDELLDVSRISAGRLTLQPSTFDLAEAVTEVLARSGDQLARAGCRLDLRADRAVRGAWDRVRVEQIVSSLVSNAIKYGRGKPIEIRVESDAKHARLSVRDFGIGVPPADQQRIFERFERAVSTSHFGGLGLGLWIVRQLVEAHGGAIRVDSAPDEGAHFEVDLPFHRPEQPELVA